MACGPVDSVSRSYWAEGGGAGVQGERRRRERRAGRRGEEGNGRKRERGNGGAGKEGNGGPEGKTTDYLKKYRMDM